MVNFKRGVAAVRRSSSKQAENQSFVIQKEKIKQKAMSVGFQVNEEDIFEEDGVSAFKNKANQRKGLQKMKEAILNENIDGVFFYDFSRMDRTGYSFVSEFYDDIVAKKPHVTFWTTSRESNWEPSDLDVKLFFIMANQESMQKSVRAIDAQKKDLKAKSHPGSTIPFGYKYKDKKLKIDDTQAFIVTYIYYLSSWGYSVKKISDILNGAFISSPRGSKWNSSTVDNILNNKVYLGNLNWDFSNAIVEKEHVLIENFHEPIVSNHLYELVQATRKIKSKWRKLDTPFLLSGLVCCCRCKDILSHRNASTKKYNYFIYQCKNCGYDVPAHELNKIVVSVVSGLFNKAFKINDEYIKSYLKNCFAKLEILIQKDRSFIDTVLAKKKLIETLEMKDEHLKLLRLCDEAVKKVESLIEDKERHLTRISNVMNPEEIDALSTFYKNLDITSLSNQELRLILIQFIEKVELTFIDSTKIQCKVKQKDQVFQLVTG